MIKNLGTYRKPKSVKHLKLKLIRLGKTYQWIVSTIGSNPNEQRCANKSLSLIKIQMNDIERYIKRKKYRIDGQIYEGTIKLKYETIKDELINNIYAER